MDKLSLNKIAIVYIAEKIEDYGPLTIFNKGLEQESIESSQYILGVLESLFREVYYYPNVDDFIANIKKHKEHLIFPNWFGIGSRCRNSFIPTICEANNMKFIGADAYTRLMSSDKYTAKLFVEQFNIKTPKGVLIHYNEKEILSKISHLQLPLIVKPNFEGNSIGIHQSNFCNKYNHALLKINELLRYFEESILVEEYIEGEELKVFLFGNRKDIFIFEEQSIFIGDKKYFDYEILDYEKKFDKNIVKTKITNILDENEKDKIVNVFQSLTKAEYMRFDFRCNKKGYFLLELSPDCSIRKNSTPHRSFIKNGFEYEDMIAAFALNALSVLNKL